MNSNPSPEKTHKEYCGSLWPSQLLFSVMDTSWHDFRDRAIPSETHPLKSEDSLASTMQLDWYHLFVTGWPVTLK